MKTLIVTTMIAATALLGVGAATAAPGVKPQQPSGQTNKPSSLDLPAHKPGNGKPNGPSSHYVPFHI